MALSQYRSGNALVHYKLIKGTAHPTFAGSLNPAPVALGLAFRTADAPLGYLCFYGARDFDLSGDVSWVEQAVSRLPVDMSAVASPPTRLLQAAAADLEFLGSGEADLTDIQRPVRNDLLGHAMRAASGVLVDGIMLALGGPSINALVGQLVTSKVKQFIVSKAISAVAKQQLKAAAGFDAGKFLGQAP